MNSTADCLLQSAWPVNFGLNLLSFESQLEGEAPGIVHSVRWLTHIAFEGLQNLIQTLTTSLHTPHSHFIFCSSIASVFSYKNYPSAIKEELSSDPEDAGGIGYSQSKWVAENICAAAASKLDMRVDIARLGQLCGDTSRGVWNQSEAWPLLIKASVDVGAFPDLKAVRLQS